MDDRYNPPWRTLYTALYARPTDSKVYGSMDIDFEAALEFMDRQEGQGLKLTATHLVLAAIGRTIAEDCPELNCMIVRGKAVPRDGIHVSVVVAIADSRGTAMTKLENVDQMPLSEIAAKTRERAKQERSTEGGKDTGKRQSLASIPWPLRRWMVRFMAYLLTEWGVDMPWFGVTKDSFGSVLLSNIGSFHIDNGLLALLPVARVSVAAAIGRVSQKPMVVDGQVVARWVLPVSATFDHRLVDGAMIGRFVNGVKRRLEEPTSLEKAATPLVR